MLLSWHYVTRAAYDAAPVSSKTADKLFFLSDTHEIYRGTENFTESVIVYSSEPTTKAVGKLYVNATTLEGKIWNGSTWSTVIQPVQAAIVAGDTSKPVSSKAVEDYVADQISAVTGSDGLVAAVEYAAATKSINVTMADGSSDSIQLTGLAVDLVYDTASGKLQVKDATGATVGTGVNLDLERFVTSAEYDEANHKIVLTFNDGDTPLEIDVADLVDTYTAGNTSTIAMTVTGNQFTAEAIVASTAGNQLKKTADGLYVAAVDISGKVDKVSGATAGDIATLTADGNIADSKVKAGGATLAASPSASVLATEAAVAAVRTALTSTINDGLNTKMNKVEAGAAGEVIIASDSGDAEASGKTIGGSTFNATPNADTLATEAGVVSHVTGYAVAKASVVAAGNMAETTSAASNDKVVSEKALVDAMTWKTTV